ncbi:hypothetical protein [Streptomyces paludis]|uniref:DUF2613 family protein n=1 Tax=Streptomyces paludis TaxID=2282738 RepID=A0A345HWE6_9ACTN|nr:hypothetical protein [Streptomyces paludis]AXG81020.1 hypothetical protein DVK44_28835 [Streptomyces paludis]
MDAIRVTAVALGLAAATVLLGVGTASAAAHAGHEDPQVAQTAHYDGDTGSYTASFLAIN